MRIQFQTNTTNYLLERKFTEKQNVTINSILQKELPYDVQISDEGHTLYRSSLVKEGNSSCSQKVEPELDRELLNKSIIEIEGITQSAFHSRFKSLNTQGKMQSGECTALDLAGNCFKVYTEMYNEIKQGYAEGTREFWVLDENAENGFRKVTEEEELAVLDSAYDFYAQVVDAYVSGKAERCQRIEEAVNRTQADLQNQKYVNKRQDKNGDNEFKINELYYKLIKARDMLKDAYSIAGNNIPLMAANIFEKTFGIVITKSTSVPK